MSFDTALERVTKEIPRKREEEREERLYRKALRDEDNKLGKTQDLIDGPMAGKDMDDPREHCLTQDRIDTVRANVTFKTLLKAYEKEDMTFAQELQYLWFPENDIRKIELRFGNPPADSDRPKHLRRFDLVMDHMAAPGPLHAIIQHAAMNLRNTNRKLVEGNNIYKRAIQDDHKLAQALRGKLRIT